ncbi:MAG: hypothetical protein AAGE80_06315 [Pseudomonadota bacterium]
MLLFRFICAILMAWAMNIALARPEALALLEESPDFPIMAAIGGAIVGFINLAKRQGWGMVVALANGIWAGILTIVVSILVFLIAVPIARNWVAMDDFGDFTRITSQALDPLIDQFTNAPLVVVILIHAAVVGIITEAIHWSLVRALRKRAESRD